MAGRKPKQEDERPLNEVLRSVATYEERPSFPKGPRYDRIARKAKRIVSGQQADGSLRQSIVASKLLHADKDPFDPNDDLWRVRWKQFGFAYSCVYLITPRDTGWPVKIGLSNHPATRVVDLQVAHWNPLTVAKCWVCEDAKQARRVEQRAHAVLRREGGHLLGEWFDLRSDRATQVVEAAAASEGIEAATRLPPTEKFAAVFTWLELGRKERDALRSMQFADQIDAIYGPEAG